MNAALDRSKCGFSTKIYTKVDALANLWKFILTAGQKNDIIQAEKLIIDSHCTTLVAADKGYR